MNARQKKNAREKERWSNLSPEQREAALVKKRLNSAQKRAKEKNEKVHMEANLNRKQNQINELKERNKELESNFVEVLNCFLPSKNDHVSTCQRLQKKKTRKNISTRVDNGVQYSCIAPLKDKTAFNVYIGSHLEKRMNSNGHRVYHTSTKMEIDVEVGEIIIFDGNLCHCGGDSTVTNPRIFSTFGSTFKALEKNNYIKECIQCSNPCFKCSSIEKLREKGLFFGDVKRYSTFSLINHGFTIINVGTWKATVAFDREFKKLSNWDHIAGINFHDMGQDALNRGKKLKRTKKRAIISANTCSSSVLIQKNLPAIEKWFKTFVVETVEKKLSKVTKTKYKVNEYTLFLNAKDGANEQEVHMDNALLCNC
jgi:hypothetical protein